MINKILNQKIAILGYGVNNQALLKWLIKHGVKDITVCDRKSQTEFPISNFQFPSFDSHSGCPEPVERAIKSQILNLKFQTGKKYLDGLEKFDVVFRTPGISYLHPKIQEALKKGVEISSQTKLFFDLCPAKIVGITGTKGKGTTAVLISEILANSISHIAYRKIINDKPYAISKKPKVFLAGNIGTDPFEFLDKLTPNDWVILELSSFQLQDLEKSPNIAVVLNITSDHLDYHKNTKEYVDAKTNIVRYQSKKDFTVINLDYLTSFQFASASPTENDYYFSTSKSVDLGAFVLKNKIILRTEKEEYQICKISDIKLLGSHNLENICAAVTASYLAGADIQSIKKVITTFAGRVHRLEFVREHKGVKFYNDSASTNPETAIAAVKSFSPPIILIAGGSDKGADYEELGKEISAAKNIKKVILVGKTTKKIVSSIKNQELRIKKKTIEKLNNFEKAVQSAIQSAKLGDVVLLSPASASFDMFKNYEERGDIFKKIVNNIK